MKSVTINEMSEQEEKPEDNPEWSETIFIR